MCSSSSFFTLRYQAQRSALFRLASPRGIRTIHNSPTYPINRTKFASFINYACSPRQIQIPHNNAINGNSDIHFPPWGILSRTPCHANHCSTRPSERQQHNLGRRGDASFVKHDSSLSMVGSVLSPISFFHSCQCADWFKIGSLFDSFDMSFYYPSSPISQNFANRRSEGICERSKCGSHEFCQLVDMSLVPTAHRLEQSNRWLQEVVRVRKPHP